MGRQRVSKEKIMQEKNQKVIEVLKTLPRDVSDDDFVKKFRELFPEDWKRVQKRYDEHERLTPKGKSHPMAHPYQYILNASRELRKLYSNGSDLNELLTELNTPKPKFVEDKPENLEKLLEQVCDLTSYELRIEAINILGKHKCEESVAALLDRLSNDPVYDVRETSYLRLLRFDVTANRPTKDKAYNDPEIQNKLNNVATQLKPGFSEDKFTKKFKSMYPKEFDLQKYHLKNRFNHWLKKTVENLSKT